MNETEKQERPDTAQQGGVTVNDLARSALVTADLIERFYQARPQTAASRRLCDRLRSFARDLAGEDKAYVARVQETTERPHHPEAGREQADRRTGTHATPVGSGGMGPLMNLTANEERGVNWGEDFHDPHRNETGKDSWPRGLYIARFRARRARSRSTACRFRRKA